MAGEGVVSMVFSPHFYGRLRRRLGDGGIETSKDGDGKGKGVSRTDGRRRGDGYVSRGICRCNVGEEVFDGEFAGTYIDAVQRTSSVRVRGRRLNG